MTHSTNDDQGSRIDVARALAAVQHVSFASPAWRSPLEERAARVLDRRGVRWQYERHTFTLDDGRTYTPDLWCPEIGVIIEVKGDRAPERLDKPIALAQQLDPSWGSSWHGDVDVHLLDEWGDVAGDYKDVLGWATFEAYRDEVIRRVPQVWIWTQTQLVHVAGQVLNCSERRSWEVRCAAGCCNCRSYWVVCASCARVQPHCTEAPRTCRCCGGATAQLARFTEHAGIDAQVWL